MSTRPPLSPTPLGLEPTFGFGDRLGLATPGHLDAVRRHAGPIRPIFAQQSIREMQRTGRSAAQVLAAAEAALAAEGYVRPWGADGDHLKTPADVDTVARAGFTFFTIDPSDHVDAHADDDDATALDAKFARVRDAAPWASHYEGRTVRVGDGLEIHFDRTTVRRAVVKYGRAIAHSLALATYIGEVMAAAGRAYELELSVDETPQPTTPAEHYIIADRFREAGVRLVSLAPRYVGDFEKGVDFRGDVAAFERCLAQHAAIAAELGPYKLSLHSGSDKLSIYSAFARITRGRFHVKTAGTSYLEALRVVARHDAPLFRKVVALARERFETDRASYHISAELGRIPAGQALGDVDLERVYLDEDAGRQVLHVTFGSVLTRPGLRDAIRAVLAAEPATHRDVLADHLGKHLIALRGG
ncbi:MAG: tagaturonate epimerase family protein [Phycisphaeraceae bacterium]